MRELTVEQYAVLERTFTDPLYIVELGLGGTQYYSTSRDIEVDGVEYKSGFISISNINNWQEVTLEVVNPDYALNPIILSGLWRGQICKISWVPVSQQLYFEPGYVEPGYYDPLTIGEPVVIIDGELVSASLGERVSLRARARGLARSWTTRQRIEAPTFNHLPAPGTTVTVNGEIFTIEAAK